MKIDWYKIEEWMQIAVFILIIAFGSFVITIVYEKQGKELKIFTQKCHEAQGIVIEEAGNERLVCIPVAQIKIGKDNDKQ